MPGVKFDSVHDADVINFRFAACHDVLGKHWKNFWRKYGMCLVGFFFQVFVSVGLSESATTVHTGHRTKRANYNDKLLSTELYFFSEEETASPIDRHEETKTVQQKLFLKFCVTNHLKSLERMNRNFLRQFSQESPNTANRGQLFEAAMRAAMRNCCLKNQPRCELDKRPTPTVFFRSHCSWCPAIMAIHNYPTTNCTKDPAYSGVVQHYLICSSSRPPTACPSTCVWPL